MLAGYQKKLFAIACLCVLLIQPAYSLGLFDTCCPSAWQVLLIFSPPLLLVLILNCSFSTIVSFMIFHLVWFSFLRREFIRRNWRSKFDSRMLNRCLWTWVPIGTLLGLFSAISLGELTFFSFKDVMDRSNTFRSWLVFIQIVQIIQGVLWFCVVAFYCRNLKYKAPAHHGLPNPKEI